MQVLYGHAWQLSMTYCLQAFDVFVYVLVLVYIEIYIDCVTIWCALEDQRRAYDDRLRIDASRFSAAQKQVRNLLDKTASISRNDMVVSTKNRLLAMMACLDSSVMPELLRPAVFVISFYAVDAQHRPPFVR